MATPLRLVSLLLLLSRCRCGSNSCVGSDLDPLLHYDANGNLIGQMGAGLFAFPHGIHVDDEGNVWVTDPLPADGRGAGGSVGQQVTKLSPTGAVLLQLGTRLVAGQNALLNINGVTVNVTCVGVDGKSVVLSLAPAGTRVGLKTGAAPVVIR